MPPLKEHGTKVTSKLSSKCSPRIVSIRLEDLLHLASPNANIPTIKQRQTHCIVQQTRKWRALAIGGPSSSFISDCHSSGELIGDSDSHPYRLHCVRHAPYATIRAEDLGFETQFLTRFEVTGTVLQGVQGFPGQQATCVRTHLDVG